MSDIFTHSPFADPSNTAPGTPDPGSAPLVPPPPEESMEVTIRTMASDLELMIKGGVPTPPPVTVVSISPTAATASTPVLKIAGWTAAIVLGAGAVFSAGYFILPFVLPSPAEKTDEPPVKTAPPTVTLPQDQAPSPGATVHASFFGKEPSERIVLDIPAGEGRVEYEKALASALFQLKASSTFIEAEVRIDGKTASWTEFVRRVGITLPAPDFWSFRLENDFTMFIYREGRNFSAGYVLKRKDSQSALLVKNALRELENDRGLLSRFFIGDPKAIKGDFSDIQIGGQPFRQVFFEAPAAVFMYGWIYNNYLLIATSEGGFKKALEQF
jgi:hypothetical protein